MEPGSPKTWWDCVVFFQSHDVAQETENERGTG